ncbi:endonuclease/exonuclease/phosphatase family protein [Saccharopolyspora gloriosae]|uniref:Endonuclease/exonuclease/phosphatase (EEP) superfamily protein YafD n=1 Tax=Saccharopolyspora gloriosae TaxID=455344 RepID=A0A840NL14_9PSEU|nr:endonuclease/exonuclease/phosphatase family protein [Saccharopolyspora gloriosae]MBB5072264.1 endonuclease/exonuclease/phosphatase (EEP) superfamily protein YafD [Saccharopolyspora gloriosae]
MDTAVAEPEIDSAPRRRKSGLVTALFVLAVLGTAGWATPALLGFDTANRYTIALVATLQYAVPVGSVLTVLGLVLRRWLTTLVVGLLTVVLAILVLPRAIPDSPTPVQGSPLRVLSVNLFFGRAQADRVVDLVRDGRIDVLSLQELTPQAVAELDRAGLAELLPHRVLHSGPRADGTGIASRYPLRELALVPPTSLAQPSALIDLPGPRDVEFVAVHPIYPMGADTADGWLRELTALPRPGGAARVLAGDFNATLDHSPLRALLGGGYADAAEVTGGGLTPTWGAGWMPRATIDHVLTSEGLVTQDYAVFDVPGSDHRAVRAHVVIPN